MKKIREYLKATCKAVSSAVEKLYRATIGRVRLSGGNIKLGDNMMSWSKLFGQSTYELIDKSGCSNCVKGSCGGHCQGCEHDCYVKKSYRYPSVVKGHARNTLAMRISLAMVFNDLHSQLTRRKVQSGIVRINQSGELESVEEFRMWCELAKLHPTFKFYLYTKAYEIVSDDILSGMMPENMTCLISIWHEFGIEEYKKLAHVENVKAFVYDDGFDYASHGINIQTYCKAYDLNGKLDHNITCQVCQKCFNRVSKVIGSYPH